MEKIPEGDSLLEKKKEWKARLTDARAWRDTANRMSEESNKDYDNLDGEDKKDADIDRAQAIEAQDDYELICKEIKKELTDFFSGDYLLAEEEFEKIEEEASEELKDKNSNN